ncbi:hypothetical protein F4775DRAFT_265475 [Biscogniauxia sp. FL1348]|nr:hypothetical protein F4775DRAFT_265475 [Biscogniauxia sp. FL1348]
MARQRNTPAKPAAAKRKDAGPPAPFKRPPEVLAPLIATLDEKHAYIIHVDHKPAGFKRKIFAVPVLMNLAVAALFAWRAWYVGPYYLSILASVLGYANEATMVVDEMEWGEIAPVVLRRGLTFALDSLLFVFLWPWPVEFFLRRGDHGNPVMWRYNVGFRDREVVVRRSRAWRDGAGDFVNDDTCKSLFMARIGAATAPMVIGEKTGYVLMNEHWDLDWAAMVDATIMVDQKMAALVAFTLVVLVFHEEYGWLCVDMKAEDDLQEDGRRRQVFAFRDALAAVGKDDLFYRWIEIIQFESSQPGGFGPEKQEKAAKEIRDMFQKDGIDFDQFWKDSVGSDSSLGLQT